MHSLSWRSVNRITDFNLILILYIQGRDVDLLFGLDMLKAHQACIDLEKNVLRIQGREVKFLAEHELPDKARILEIPINNEGAPVEATAEASSSTHFPGSGNTLGVPPGPSNANVPAPPAQIPARSSSQYSDKDIDTLMNLGATRDTAIQALQTAGGNVEYAAALIFNV